MPRGRPKKHFSQTFVTPEQILHQKLWRSEVKIKLGLSCRKSSRIVMGHAFTLVDWFDQDYNIYFREVV